MNHDSSIEQARLDAQAVGAASFILSLRARGIRDTGVLRAMELVPRGVFAPRRFGDLSRADVALPLPCGQTMTAPGTVAAMLVALGVEPGQRVLEIGTGSGYVTALLQRLGAVVVTVERFATLARAAEEHLKVAGAAEGVRIETGDGLAPRPRERFDRILLNGSVMSTPEIFVPLLGPGGRLVGALAQGGAPRLLRLDKGQDSELREDFGGSLRIAPLLPGMGQTL